jgi:hypothetical protein
MYIFVCYILHNDVKLFFLPTLGSSIIRIIKPKVPIKVSDYVQYIHNQNIQKNKPMEGVAIGLFFIYMNEGLLFVLLEYQSYMSKV